MFFRYKREQLLATTTFCTGYWQIANNQKHSKSHYIKVIPLMMDLLTSGNIILFYNDEDVLHTFESSAKSAEVKIVPYKLSVSDLPAYPLSGSLTASCKAMETTLLAPPDDFRGEKGVIHYWRDYKGSGEAAYRDLISIWISKIALVSDAAISRNPFGSDRFAWVDASIARHNYQRTNWDFTTATHCDEAVSHYGSVMRFNGRMLPINASFFLARPPVWRILNDSFQRQLLDLLDKPYAHDEETVLSYCHARTPDLFHKIGEPVFGVQRKVLGLSRMFRQGRTVSRA